MFCALLWLGPTVARLEGSCNFRIVSQEYGQTDWSNWVYCRFLHKWNQNLNSSDLLFTFIYPILYLSLSIIGYPTPVSLRRWNYTLGVREGPLGSTWHTFPVYIGSVDVRVCFAVGYIRALTPLIVRLRALIYSETDTESFCSSSVYTSFWNLLRGRIPRMRRHI